MKKITKLLFFALIMKPIIFVILGLNIRNKNKLPLKGSAVIAPNHNSHLDAMVIMSLYPLSLIHKVRPIGAAEYFMRNKLLTWFSIYCLDLIPLDRTGNTSLERLFIDCHKALNDKDILILFPEGSRGKPEQISRLKKGLYHMLKDLKDIPVTPIYMEGLGNSLPKGEALFVPFVCKINIGDSITEFENSKQLNSSLYEFFTQNNTE